MRPQRYCIQAIVNACKRLTGILPIFETKANHMKNIITALLVCTIFYGCDVIKQLPQSTGVTEYEAAEGIKEALSQGLAKSVLQLNREDGFFRDAFYKILLPPEGRKVENTLRDIGLGSMVDKAILQINRGAEDAAGYARPIFANAIKSMTINDAIGLVRNGDSSATHFFREKTTAELTAAFLPVIKASLDKVNATKYYGDIVNRYNSIPLVLNKVNPDLNGYVTSKAINALFDLVAKEEKNIRTNFAARTSELLRKVFGQKW